MLRTFRSRQIVAGVLVTVVTVAVIGVVLVALTPVGCGPANAVGLKSISNRCVKPQPVAIKTSPRPGSGIPTPSPIAVPYTPPASAPYYPPASQPYYPPASSPYNPPGSPSYLPFYPPASGGAPVIPLIQVTCTLPVYAGPPGSGGFISFPSGSFTPDPKSSVTLPSPSPGSPSPLPPVGPGPGYGYGYPGLSWDFAQKKWLPVPSSWVTPDGSKYAFTSPNSIYVQDVAGGALVELGEGKAWSILGVFSDGVYAVNPQLAGLWVLPYSSAPRQISTTGYWQAVSTQAAYGTETSAVPQGVSTTIIRLDLKTGAIDRNWFTQPASSSYVAGFDGQGNAIVYVSSFSGQGSGVWITTGSGIATAVMGTGNGVFVNGPPVADSHGVWFSASIQDFNGTTGGQVLYVPNSGVYGMSRIGGQLAGGCN